VLRFVTVRRRGAVRLTARFTMMHAQHDIGPRIMIDAKVELAFDPDAKQGKMWAPAFSRRGPPRGGCAAHALCWSMLNGWCIGWTSLPTSSVPRRGGCAA
jgi:hypothetical protein